MRAVIVQLVIYCGLLQLQNVPHFTQMPPAEIDLFLKEMRKQEPDFTQRLINITDRFLGTRYLISPLGEGEGNPPDTDPIMRFDAIDCVTLVEEAIALARSESLGQASVVLQRIRYLKATIAYRYRKHFMMAQWIPDNQKAGFLEDITESIAGQSTIWITKRLGPQIWNQRINKHRWPKLSVDDIPNGEVRLPIVPIKRMNNFQANVPDGAIMVIVRQDLPTIPERVSHIGIVVSHNGRRYVRHAASGKVGKVIDERLDAMIQRHIAYRRWPVSGYNFQRVLAGIEPRIP
jgi:hypothetical protein